MMDSLLPLIAALGAAASVLVLLLGVSQIRPKVSSVRDRLEMATKRANNHALDQELHQSLMERAIRPMIAGLNQFIQSKVPQNSMESVARKITNADLDDQLDAPTFATLRTIACVGCGIVMTILFFTMHIDSLMAVLLGLVVAVIGYMFPLIWLNGKVRERQDAFRMALPDAIDLLTLCLDAVPSFESAVRRVADRSNPIVGKEFAYMLSLMRVTGLSRSDALQKLVERVGLEELRLLVTAVAQADVLGTPLAEVFRRQSEDMRVRRRLRAETLARQAPVKMMFPMVLLVFPPLFIVILGPSIPQILHTVAPDLHL